MGAEVKSTKSSEETVKLRPAGAAPEFLGEWCVRRGLATAAEIESCLLVQKNAEASGAQVPRLGEILVSRGILTANQVAEALNAQKKEIRSCARCGIQVNVATRGDAAAYRCARCNGPLSAAEGAPAALHAVEEDFILVSKDPVPEDVQSLLKNPAARFGKYVLLRKLGQGGIGVVYLAWDTYLSQHVALKRLRSARTMNPQDTPQEHVQSLLKEARHSIRLRHPGIVSVFDVGRVGREYYVAMEYLDGDTLLERINAAKRNGSPSPFFEDPRTTLNQLIEIARALEYAHSRPSPIIHCDLKPANVLIDRENHAHVLDFGLAKNLELDKPERGEISGTPSYMAPEQASGESDKIDRRTDVYAFGAMLYEMLTGRPPFTGGTMEILGQTVSDVPETPTTTLRRIGETKEATPPRPLVQIPPALEELCMKCLQKNREDRPQSMTEVAAALEVTFKVEKPAPKPEAVAPAAAPAPAPAIRSRVVPVMVAVAAAVLLVVVALAFSPRPAATSTANPFDRRETAVFEAIARFDAASARSLALRLRDEAKGGADELRATRLAEEATWVDQLQSRVAEKLSSGAVELPVLRTRHGARSAVRVAGADRLGLRLLQEGRSEFVGWEQLDPAGLPDLCCRALGEPSDADLLALGIFALRGGRDQDAARCFDRLRTGPLGPVADRYQLSSIR